MTSESMFQFSLFRCFLYFFLVVEFKCETNYLNGSTVRACHLNGPEQRENYKLEEKAWHLLESYMETICTRCARRVEVECGCALGQSNPAFLLLHTQAVLQSRYMMQLNDNCTSVDAQTWVVYTVQGGGIGNTLHDLSTALALAIAMGRALAVDLLVRILFLPPASVVLMAWGYGVRRRAPTRARAPRRAVGVADSAGDVGALRPGAGDPDLE